MKNHDGTMEKKAVRRDRQTKRWACANKDYVFLVGQFEGGLMKNVLFVHVAPPITCQPDSHCSGEAVGLLVKSPEAPGGLKKILGLSKKAPEAVMPDNVVRTVEIHYDNKVGRFHEKGKPENVIHKADYLLLQADGKAVAGWVS